jgi:catechol-2,3-dioxygenase
MGGILAQQRCAAHRQPPGLARDAAGKLHAMEIKELGHLVLYVHDIERSAAFYRDVLGWKQLRTSEDSPLGRVPVALFSSGRTHHELLLIEVGEDAQPLPRGRHVGLYHFGLKVGESDDELREAIGRCREAGVHVVGMSDHTVTHSLYITDPDGNEIELYIDVPGVSWDLEHVMAPVKALAL